MHEVVSREDGIWHFSVGDVVIRSSPLAAALRPQLSGSYCDECLKPSTSQTVRCQSCRFATYCGSACQKKHSVYHRDFECAMLREFGVDVPDVTFRLFAKLVYKLHGKPFSCFEERLFNGEQRTFQDLMDHCDDILESPALHTRFRIYYSMLRHCLPRDMCPDYSRALQIFGKMMINRFSVQNDMLEAIGEALYIGPSIHDHACAPDAGFTFNGAILTLRASRLLVVTHPRQVFICYMDILQSREDRISYLEERYFFRCNCTYCSDANNAINRISTKRQALRDTIRAGLMSCFADEPPDHKMLDALHQRTVSMIAEDDDDQGNSGGANAELSAISYWKIEALAVAFECAERLKRDEDAVRFGTRLLALYRSIYGECRPCVSVLHYRLAVCLSTNDTGNFHLALRDAHQKLLLTHGEDHPLAIEAKHLLSTLPAKL